MPLVKSLNLSEKLCSITFYKQSKVVFYLPSPREEPTKGHRKGQRKELRKLKR